MSFAWVLVPIAYLVGTFPTAHLIGRFVGVDPTIEGSGNPGASNMIRVAGLSAGAVVLLGDVLKAAVPALVGYAAGGRVVAAAAGAAATVGHVLPLQRRFRGGKGVATFSGTSMVIWPIAAAAGLLTWLLLVRFTHRASVGSMVAAVVVPVGVAVVGRPVWEIALATGLALLVLVRHWSNLVRLVRRRESAL